MTKSDIQTCHVGMQWLNVQDQNVNVTSNDLRDRK